MLEAHESADTLDCFISPGANPGGLSKALVAWMLAFLLAVAPHTEVHRQHGTASGTGRHAVQSGGEAAPVGARALRQGVAHGARVGAPLRRQRGRRARVTAGLP